uniref:Oxidative stress induced growth inhibitor family member 2 n=1 Tax=Latimeria chalumnae TaxID=7897 RepID=H3AH04_LATCH
IVIQDLEYLCEGLEGRSSNPVAVLFDTLLHPNADIGYDYPSVLQWKLEQQHYIPHVVLGKGLPGGAWHAMEESMLTISLDNWMELPGLDFKDWASGKRRIIKTSRATAEEIAFYYKHYVKVMGLQKNFMANTYVTSVSRLFRIKDKDDHNLKTEKDKSSRELSTSSESEQTGLPPSVWEVRGYQRVEEKSHVPFCFFAENVVLATGTHDSPIRLAAEGEDLPFVFHSISNLEVVINKRKQSQKIDPVLIVGAGLTAADAIVCAYNKHIPIIHVFRRRIDDPSLIFKQLSKKLYPEYHKVYHMMYKQSYATASSIYPDYTSFPEHCVLSFSPDMRCVLQSVSGIKRVYKISMALILIGAHPNLSFFKDQGQGIGRKPNQPISCKNNSVDIDPYTYECVKESNLFAMGPLVGDNFVRFLKGGALSITKCLAKKQKKKGQLIVEKGGGNGVA